MAVRSERTERGLRGLREELGLNVERSFGFRLEEVPNSEDEKNEIDGDTAVVAIFTDYERLRVRCRGLLSFPKGTKKIILLYYYYYLKTKIACEKK